MKDALRSTFPEVSGASVRKGCISECASEMPVEHTAVASGHTLRRESAMWDYVSWTLPAGANAWNHIAGWPARPWGQCTTVAKPASLQPLREIGVAQETIDRMVDTMFHINDSACPHLRSTAWEPPLLHAHRESMLQKRAQCRSFVEASFASMLMYYKDRKEKKEMLDINISLEQVVRNEIGLDSAHDLVVEWGSLIHTYFVRDNAHLLTTSSSDSADKELLQCIKGMAATIGQYGAQLAAVREEVKQMNHTQMSMASIMLQLQQGMQQNQNFALHCFTTPGLTTAVTASVNSPCPPTPAPPGAFADLHLHLSIHVYIIRTYDPTTRHSSCTSCYSSAPPSDVCTPSTCSRSVQPSPSSHWTPDLHTSSPSNNVPAPLVSPVATMPTQVDVGESVSTSDPPGPHCRVYLSCVSCSHRYTRACIVTVYIHELMSTTYAYILACCCTYTHTHQIHL